MRQVAIALAAACLLMNTVSAQTFGGITGEVKDSSGAIMPSIAITVTNIGTNAARSVVTNASGIYNVPDLVPGNFQIKVSASGFQQMVSTVEIQVQQLARVDFTLTVGQATRTVEVSASAASLTTENATVGTLIENQRINDLPLNGRDYFQLVALSPNVNYGFAAAAQASGREGGTRATITISQIGERATWQYYSLDGVTNTDIDFNLYIVLPSVDALQEFKVQSGVYPAEFGREAGQVNVATKPGTNNFHGTAFEFLRNDALDAKPYDFVPPVPAKQPYRQNQYGYTVGGPVWIPKLFNGKNKLFFMSNFEGFKTRLTTLALATTLPAAMRTGDFSSLKNITLLDSATRVQNQNGSYSASPFPNNQIPTARINPQTLQLLGYDPLPNEPSQSATQLFDNYLYNANTPVNKNQVTQRIDFNESTNSQWFGRYSWTGENGLMPGITSNDGSTLVTHANQWVVSNTRIFSSTKVNEARFGYSRIFNQIGQQLTGVTNVDAAIGVPVTLPTGNLWGIPNVSLTNSLTSFGNPTNGPYVIDDKYYQWIDNFSWIHGKHSFRLGGEYRRDRFPSFGNEFTRGQFTFSGDYNPNTLAGGCPGADLILGAPSTVNMAVRG